jgi:hypothetical protein
MTALEKIRDFVKSYPGADILKDFQVDYTDQVPANGGIFPSGLVEVERRQDIAGRVTVRNQYNFGLYYVFEKAPGDDDGAAVNADWLMDFQEWIQEQSAMGIAPVFGDVPRDEVITAQNGVLYAAEDEGLATYMVQLSVKFTKKYEVKNKWLT